MEDHDNISAVPPQAATTSAFRHRCLNNGYQGDSKGFFQFAYQHACLLN